VTRWRLAKQLLTDPSIDPADRFAGCLILLYAQPLTRIAALRRSAIRVSPDGTATLSLGREPVELPPPLAGLASHLPLRRTGRMSAHLDTESWLFPGRNSNQHLHPASLGRRLQALGIDSRRCRNTALLQLGAELPAAVLADMLGMHIVTADQWTRDAGAGWNGYVPAHLSREAEDVGLPN